MTLSAPVETALACVHAHSGAGIGAGFLVADRTVLTCAHVVCRALGGPDHSEAAPPGTVRISFPILDQTRMFKADTVRWRTGGRDIALLELAESAPDAARPVRLISGRRLVDVETRAGGFPAGGTGASWARCTIIGHARADLVQTEDQRASGIPIQPGFSGGPLWSDRLEGVVGMTVGVAARPDLRTSYAITSDVLVEAVPALREHALAPTPYRGLRAFEEEESALFFGRETLTDQIAGLLEDRRDLVLTGPSGCGKSSVLRAGVLPRLTGGGRAPLLVRPGDEGLASVEAALDDGAPRLIVVDQAEEAITAEAVDMVARVVTAASASRATVRALLAVRSDFLDALLGDPRLTGLGSFQIVPVPRMTDAQLRAAITGPLPGGVTFAPGLVERIIAAVREAPTPLPLLQFTLARLWGAQRNGEISHDVYDEMGGLAGAIDGYAEEVWSLLEDDEQGVARRLFTRLLRSYPGHPPVGKIARFDELGPGELELAQRPAPSRLVAVSDRDLRFAHEALIVHWDRLRRWAREDERFLTWREELRADVVRWEKSGRDEALLLRGPALADAHAQQRDNDDRLLEPDRRFIAESARVRARRRRRRHVLEAVIATLAAVAVGGGLVAEVQRRQADREVANSASRTLATELGTDEFLDETAVLRAVAAYRTAPTKQAADTLFEFYTETRPFDRMLSIRRHQGKNLGPPVFDPALRHVGAIVDLRARLWRLTPEGATAVPPSGMVASDMTVSGDGKVRAVVADPSVTVVDESGRELRTFPRPSPPKEVTVALSATGDRVAIHQIGQDGVKVFDVRSGALLRTFPVFSGGTGSIVLTDRYLLTASPGGMVVHGLADGSRREFGLWDRSWTAFADTDPLLLGCADAGSGATVHVRRMTGAEETFPVGAGCDDRFAVSPDGRYVAGRETDEYGNASMRIIALDTRGAVGARPFAPFHPVGLTSTGPGAFRLLTREPGFFGISTFRLGRMETTADLGAHLVSPDGRHLVTLRSPGRDGHGLPLPGTGFDIWDARDHRHLGGAALPETTGLSITDDGRHLIVRSAGAVEVRTMPGLELRWRLDEQVAAAELGADGAHLVATDARGRTQARDMRTGAPSGPVLSLPAPEYVMGEETGRDPPQLTAVTDEPEMIYVVGADARSIERWNWRTGRRVDRVPFPGKGTILALRTTSRPGRLGLMLRVDDVVRSHELWDIGDGTLRRQSTLISGDWKDVRPLNIDGDGLIGAHDGQRLKVWDIDGRTRVDLPVPTDMIPFSVDADVTTLLANGEADGALTYSLRPADWIDHLCGIVTDPELSAAEKRDLPTGIQTENLC
ncbi:serine protease [Actinomadura algeriensis]|uniref:Novel STAND NTPase 1 domain-containing protein n=1 Tax=Actinomadura algeriensis TaxID=1679523 RepID=A0ABR9K3R9_9ACTN|nr:serine protease [Actinomadura algeriensis]MBE1537181.1 hypothetical protein [Actinomadura algeriensis]